MGVVKIAYIRRDGKVVYYSNKGITTGYIPPIHMPIGVVGFVENGVQAKRNIDLVATLRDLEQKGYPPEILTQIVAKGDIGAFQEWLKRFPSFYDPGALFIMYLVERTGSDRIVASVITSGFLSASQQPSTYKGIFIDGKHSTGLIQARGSEEVPADQIALAALSRNLKTRFGAALEILEIELPVTTYSRETGRAILSDVIKIRPKQGIETLLS